MSVVQLTACRGSCAGARPRQIDDDAPSPNWDAPMRRERYIATVGEPHRVTPSAESTLYSATKGVSSSMLRRNQGVDMLLIIRIACRSQTPIAERLCCCGRSDRR